MNTSLSAFFFAIAISLSVAYPSAHAQSIADGGSHGGNGGSKIEIDFKDYGLKFYRFLITEEGKSLFPEIDANAYRQALQAELDVVRRNLKDKYGKLKTCINLDINGEPLIRISRKAWRKDSKKPITQLRNAVHEYFGVAGIGGDSERLNYTFTLRITAEVAMKILISSTAAKNVAVNPLESSEVILAEAELKRETDRATKVQSVIELSSKEEAEEIAQSKQKEIDLASIRTLKCVDRIIKRRLGGKYSADYAAAILQALKDERAAASSSGSLRGLKKVSDKCDETAKGMSREKTDRWILINYAHQRQNETSNTLYGLVEAFVRPKLLKCEDRSVNVFGGALWAGKAGVGASVCTLTDGSRWIGFGVNVGMAIGAGLSVEFVKNSVSGDDGIPSQMSYNDEFGAMNIGRTPLVVIGGFVEGDLVGIVDYDTWLAIAEALENPNRPRQKQVPPGFTERSERGHKRYAVGISGSFLFVGGVRIPLIPLKKDYSHILKNL